MNNQPTGAGADPAPAPNAALPGADRAGSPEAERLLAELRALLREVAPLRDDLVAYLRAEGRLAAFVAAEKARLGALRFGLGAAAAVCLLVCWVFLGVLLWRAAGLVPGWRLLQPAVLIAQHAVAAGWALRVASKLHLKED
ncbi:MAG: hypothetical protein SF028_04635 [Candidatus Sumerlaeia bacterium]|nr:hypothetical protein [Candidatus Sumerlaeia bacterium]